jgi:hypothetical protein
MKKKTLNRIVVLWLSTEETTHANFIGILKNIQTLSEKSFLLSCQEMYAVKHTTTALVFNEAMQTLWQHTVASFKCHETSRKRRVIELRVSWYMLRVCNTCFAKSLWNNWCALSRCRQASG